MLAIDTQNLHPSTLACLELLTWLHERATFHKALEIGCGGGILSLATASIWGAQVVAIDISENAVYDTQAAAKAHGLESLVTVLRSDGFSHPAIAESAPYELILCNVLAELQTRLAQDIKKHVIPGGHILLSGILAWKAEATLQVYTGLGFEIAYKIEKSPWISCLLLSPNGHN